MDYYIKQQRAIKKIKFAWEINSFVYVYGSTGYGKTEFVKNFLQKKKYLYFPVNEHNKIDSILSKEVSQNKKQTIAVVDDLHCIDEKYRKSIKELIERKDFWVVLISRSNIPRWLVDSVLSHSFVSIVEDDLKFTKDDIEKIFLNYGFTISSESLDRISHSSQGNPYALKYVISKIQSGHTNIVKLENETTDIFIDYIEEMIVPKWRDDIKEFLLQVCLVDEFSIDLAKSITGNMDALSIINDVMEIGNFINENDGVYSIRHPLMESLVRNVNNNFTDEYIKERLYRAARFYEQSGLDTKALELYSRCNDKNKIKDILISNSRKNPGSGYYFEMRNYYFMLDEDEVKDNIHLMYAMCMLNSLLLNIDKSEYWYDSLKEKLSSANQKEKKLIKNSLLNLDIALPHRGSENILDILLNNIKLSASSSMVVPDFSITSNMPSLMNGGKDFCHWSKHDKSIAKMYGGPISKMLGDHGKGLVSTALLESFYEKSESSYDIASMLSKAKLETESVGNIELEFVVVAIQARMYIFEGNIELAEKLILSFRNKAELLNKQKLISQIDAFLCHIYLYKGENKKVSDWFDGLSDENDSFFIMNRYLYICKIRCYILYNRLTDANLLNEKLLYYSQKYERRYIKMQCNLITAVIKYRNGDLWQDEFINTLEEICQYKFTKIISEEGALLNPLLLDIKKMIQKNPNIDQKWFRNVLEETRSVSIKYSAYLKSEVENIPKFSKNAIDILKLQSEGLSNTQISKELGLNVCNVKYHIKENYKKLGVNTKTDAIILAKSLNII